MVKKQLYDSTKVANAHFRPEDRNKNDDLSSALAITHEQVTDAYAEGGIGGVINDPARQ